MKEFSNEEVREHWNKQAQTVSDGSLVTHRDKQQRIWEIEIISSLLNPEQRVLDIGCGNGYSTALFAKLVAEAHGVDYLSAMIDRAKKEFPDLPNTTFDVQDVLNLTLDPGSFDVAITARCLINLESWEAQKKGIANIVSTICKGGRYIMCEGSIQGRSAVNAWRVASGLEVMPSVKFNLDFDEDLLWKYLEEIFEIEKIYWSGIYDFVSRVVHPLYASPDQPDYDSKINEVGRLIALKLDSGFANTGREFIAVLKKK